MLFHWRGHEPDGTVDGGDGADRLNQAVNLYSDRELGLKYR